LDEEIKKRDNETKKFVSNDKILDGIDKFFDVGPEYSYQQIMDIVSEGKQRYEYEIPPGYEDSKGKNKKIGTQIFGDLIIWKQIIEYAKQESKNVIFICNDVKIDWCYSEKDSKRIIKPREELITEIYDVAKAEFWMYNISQFLFQANKFLAANIKEEEINEISEINSTHDLLKLNPERAVTLGKENINVDNSYQIDRDSRFLLLAKTSDKNQEFVVYLSVYTDQGEQKWLAFGNVKDIINKYPSEHIFRIGYANKTIYSVNENIFDKIRESGLEVKGTPIRIETVRFRSDKDDMKPISFYYKILE